MTELLHDVIHALSEIQKINSAQAVLHAKRKELMDKIGRIMDELVKEED